MPFHRSRRLLSVDAAGARRRIEACCAPHSGGITASVLTLRWGPTPSACQRSLYRSRRSKPKSFCLVLFFHGGNILFQLRVHSKPCFLRRFYFGVRFGGAAADEIHDGEIIVRLAEAGIDHDRRLVFVLGVGEIVETEVSAAD